MKFSFKKIALCVLACVLITLLISDCRINAEDIEINNTHNYDLSQYRKTYNATDNNHYKYKEEVFDNTFPFDYFSSLSLSTINDSENLGIDIVDGDIPKIYVNDAGSLIFQIQFMNITSGSIIHSLTKDKAVNNYHYEGYKLSYDSWGSIFTEKEKQTIFSNNNYIQTSEIGSGAIIVQTSYDNVNWVNVDRDKYAKGLFTTDVFNNYHGTTQKYTLDGDEIKKGRQQCLPFFA